MDFKEALERVLNALSAWFQIDSLEYFGTSLGDFVKGMFDEILKAIGDFKF